MSTSLNPNAAVGAAVEPGDRQELLDERDHLLRSLRDLETEHDAGEIDDRDYDALKDEYTARAARVLRSLEAMPETGSVSASSASASEPSGTRPGVNPGWDRSIARRRRRPPRLVVAAAVLALTGGGVALVAASAGDRLPGNPSSGSIEAGSNDELRQAQQLLGQGKALEAIKTYDQVLEDDPDHAEALAYRGWLTSLAGRQAGDQELVDRGLTFLDRAVVADPGYPDGHVFRGLVLYVDKDDPAAAIPEFKAFLANDPPREMVSLVQDSLRRAEAEVAGQPVGPTVVSPTPPTPSTTPTPPTTAR